jgi:hypothetical protein
MLNNPLCNSVCHRLGLCDEVKICGAYLLMLAPPTLGCW